MRHNVRYHLSYPLSDQLKFDKMSINPLVADHLPSTIVSSIIRFKKRYNSVLPSFKFILIAPTFTLSLTSLHSKCYTPIIGAGAGAAGSMF